MGVVVGKMKSLRFVLGFIVLEGFSLIWDPAQWRMALLTDVFVGIGLGGLFLSGVSASCVRVGGQAVSVVYVRS
jgi:hypothetical protein